MNITLQSMRYIYNEKNISNEPGSHLKEFKH